ncbi:MAG: hypothetical protein PHF86_08050 [Candidatus Nanoarchaeia archaeon]|nr:hypothetical protein [Candidatus Nanoarchaeia archaeon]
MVLEEEKRVVSKGVSISFWPIRLLFKILAYAVALLIAFILIVTIYSGLTTGQLPERVLVSLQTLNIDKPVLNAVDFIYNIATAKYVEEGQIGYVGTTKTVEEKIGINIRDFKPRSKNAQLNEPILATGQIEITKASDDQDINLKFNKACYLQDYTDLETPRQTIITPIQQIVNKGMSNFVFSVRCEFPQGFSEVEPIYVTTVSEKTTMAKTYDLKVLRFNPEFTYEQKITWLPYTKNKYVNGDQTRTPTWDVSLGPASLRIGSSDSQPFYSNDQHDLLVYVESNWPGDIKEINNIELQIPDNIQLLTDNKYCDFKRNGNTYELSTPVLQETKLDCTSKKTLNELKNFWAGRTTDLTVEECINKYKKKFEFSCPFTILDAEQVESQTPISVRANYIYEMQATSSMTLLNSGEGEYSGAGAGRTY